MKKTFKTMLALMAGTMVFTACSSNDELIENTTEQPTAQLRHMNFTAIMEGQDDVTRTTIDGSHYATDKLYDIKWVAGDKISIFDGATENNGDQEFTLDTGAGTTSGTFIGDAAEASTYYALYPYVASSSETRIPTEEDAKTAAGEYASNIGNWKKMYSMVPDQIETEISGKGFSSENQAIILAYLKNESVTIKSGPQHNVSNQFEDVVLPAEQTVAAGQFIDPKAMLMIAKSTDASTLQFKNVCAYVKVTPKFDCTAIALRSTDATKNLAGTITVDYNEGAPTATVTANGTKEVILTGTIKAGNDYYIAVLPGSLASGFTIEFLDKDKSNYYARSTSKTLALTRNNVTNLGSFATDGAWSITSPTSGTDANSHSWKLVSTNPMLKIATSVAGVCTGYADVISTFSWGDSWVLPSVADMQPLLDANAALRSGGVSLNFTFNISGIGILKYMSGICIESNTSYFWLEDGSRYCAVIFEKECKIMQANIDNSFNLLYKYIGE